MGVRDVNELDLKLLLLSGSKIKVDNLKVEPYTLEEIKDYGYTNYMMNLQWISISTDDFIKSVLDIEKRVFLETERANLKTFDFYIKLGGQEMLEGLLVALGMIFKTDDVRVLDDKAIAIDFEKLGILTPNEDGELSIDSDKLNTINETELKLVHRDNFDDIVETVKLQNYLTKPKSEKKELEDNPADEATRLLMEQMKKNEEKVQKVKKRQSLANDEDEDGIDIFDIISSVSTKSNSINKLNIWALTLYQMYDEYARLELIDNYDFSIKAMMAGAEKVDLKHWSSKQ